MLGSAVLAAVLCLLLVAPARSGTDLAAAAAHADFGRQYGLTPVDLRWYGGVQQFGYSLWTQYLTGAIGSRLAGSLAAVAAAGAFSRLLYRGAAARPMLGSLAGAVCIVGGMVSGRVTYGIGLAVALLALCALPDPSAAGGQRWRMAAATGLAGLASAASPVAGLFGGLVGVALLLTGRGREGLALAVGAALPLALTAGLFGQGGYNAMSWRDAWTAAVLSAAVLVVGGHRALRAGAALSALGVLAAYAFRTPVGLNATRLALMFAVPIVLAYAPWRAPLLALCAVGLLLVRLPVQTSDLRGAGDRVTTAAYYAPVDAELARRAPTGRVEAIPTRDYWEAVHVARVAPLARGWLRQQDTARNPLFFDGTLSAATYRGWLLDNGVQYVALPPGPLAFVGRPEGALVAGGLPYLTEVWRDAGWRLYAVSGEPALADGARVLRSTGSLVELQVAAPGDVLLRIADSRFLTLTGPGCLAPAGRWLRVHADRAGTFVVSSRLWSTGPRC